MYRSLEFLGKEDAVWHTVPRHPTFTPKDRPQRSLPFALRNKSHTMNTFGWQVEDLSGTLYKYPDLLTYLLT